MKQKTPIALLLLAFVLLAYAGCTPAGSEIKNKPRTNGVVPAAAKTQAASGANVDALFAARVDRPALPPQEEPDDAICTDYTGAGLLRICYTSDSDARLKLQVLKDDESIAYNLKGDGSVEDFSLQYGNGEYTARIMQNIRDDEYFVVKSRTFTVALSDENAVYLNSIQNVAWDYGKTPIRDVSCLVSDALKDLDGAQLLSDCSDELYEYVVQNIQYDSAKVYDLMYDYLPDIEKTYLEKAGICYDYASLFAAMLRSIGIPAKLVKGYSRDNLSVYHAWNEVFIGGKWITVDTTLDASKPGGDAEMVKNAADYIKVYEY
jgi:hypothetical protein